MIVLKYPTAYFCGYAKLPAALPTTISNSSLTLGLEINLDTGIIENVSVTLLSDLAKKMVTTYFKDKHVIKDYDSIVEEITERHQGTACKPLIKAYGDVCRSYADYMANHGEALSGK